MKKKLHITLVICGVIFVVLIIIAIIFAVKGGKESLVNDSDPIVYNNLCPGSCTIDYKRNYHTCCSRKCGPASSHEEKLA